LIYKQAFVIIGEWRWTRRFGAASVARKKKKWIRRFKNDAEPLAKVGRTQ